jgi:hypothetical protein
LTEEYSIREHRGSTFAMEVMESEDVLAVLMSERDFAR